MNCTHIRGCDDKGSEHVAMEVMQCSVKTNRISRRQLYFIGQNISLTVKGGQTSVDFPKCCYGFDNNTVAYHTHYNFQLILIDNFDGKTSIGTP